MVAVVLELKSQQGELQGHISSLHPDIANHDGCEDGGDDTIHKSGKYRKQDIAVQCEVSICNFSLHSLLYSKIDGTAK